MCIQSRTHYSRLRKVLVKFHQSPTTVTTRPLAHALIYTYHRLGAGIVGKSEGVTHERNT